MEFVKFVGRAEIYIAINHAAIVLMIRQDNRERIEQQRRHYAKVDIYLLQDGTTESCFHLGMYVGKLRIASQLSQLYSLCPRYG